MNDTAQQELGLIGMAEAIIFASPEPVTISAMIDLLQDETLTAKELQEAIDNLSSSYEQRNGGVRLVYRKGEGYQFQTVPSASLLMERMFSQRPRPLSRAAQETLAIIAYRQPVTRSDIEFIRGVDAGSILKNLLERELITCVGRRDIPGKPLTFGTTTEFLKVYQLGSLDDLPPLDAFQPSTDVLKKNLARLDLPEPDIDALISPSAEI